MGEIRFVGTGETHGYPYLVCKNIKYFMLKSAKHDFFLLSNVTMPFLHLLAEKWQYKLPGHLKS